MKKIFVYIPIIIFLSGMLFGLYMNINDLVSENGSQVIELSFSSLFLHNLRAIFCNVSGVITFGISTSINIFMTAVLLGFNIRRAINAGYGILFIFKYTLPHFTEYIAIFISGYLGFSGYELLLQQKFSKVYFFKKFILFIITIPLLLFAAFMEVTVAAR